MSDPQIDEELYSRQLYVLGLEAMKRMANASVLVSGLGGLGVEIAKNIILAGVKRVTVQDTKAATILDLGAQFYLSEADVGKNRALASLAKLTELNQHVTVTGSDQIVTIETLKAFNTVVFTEPLPESKFVEFSEFCHANKICFIACETSGVFGSVFNDFGEEFFVTDPRGEQPSRFMIEYITNSEKGIVTCADRARHNLTDGDFVKFEEVAGMTELNEKEYEVKVVNAYKFEIGDTSQFHPYEIKGSGGYGNQIISPKKLSFNTFKKSLSEPHVVDADMCCFGRDQQVMVAFATMHKLLDKYEKVTDAPWKEVMTVAQSANAEMALVENIDEVVLKALYDQYGYVISPMAGVYGGIVGQEVLKSVSGKFTPIQQSLVLSYLEAIPEKVECTLMGDRYDPYRVVFGNAQQEKMQKLRYFMIGAGAIGCEVLKNWAMMGISAGEGGKITVTDMDRIEKSNLARQFLFRDHDIGEMKSEAACKAVMTMNRGMTLEAQTNKLDESTRSIYNDQFYMGIDGVCNALDNIEARLFSDRMCVYYQKSLLESGTLGPKANYQVVMPSLTESYASSADPPEDNIPACTLHNFPSIMDHCCMWGRDIFSGIFEQAPALVNKFVEDEHFVEESKSQGTKALLESLTSIYSQLTAERPHSFDDCVKWARVKFEELFNWKIRDLLHMYPIDHMTSSGALFWTGSKRPPEPLEFDVGNEYHAEFVIAGALLHARIYGVPPETREHILSMAASTTVDAWVPSDEKIDTGDEEKPEDEKKPEVEQADLSSPEIAKLIADIRGLGADLRALNPEKFEKDDDSNSHMDFVAAAANLRALNYRIATATKLEIKRIAGKIIPAIATTTAMVCGFICLEMYKVHCVTPKKLEQLRSGFVNLAICMFALSEPIPCERKKLAANGPEFSPLWDTIDLEGDLTVKQFIETAKANWGVRVMSMDLGSKSLYTSYMNAKKKKERMPLKITEIVEEMLKGPIPDYTQFLRISCVCYNNEMEEVPMPDFRILFRK